ncbi:MAG: heparinase II/III family protein [Ferruginibacter sp.]
MNIITYKRFKITLFALLCCCFSGSSFAQVAIPSFLTEHPRLAGGPQQQSVIQQLVASEDWAKDIYDQTEKNIVEYVNRHQVDPTWIVSRLQMYWKTKSTDVFIKAGVYDHASGEAPVPTVKFPGTRDNVTVYGAPKLEDIQPYMDDPRGVYFINRSKPDQPMEWVDISKTGRTIESINTQIMTMAYNAAVLYWINGEEKYAKFAADLFDTYMTGMQYRKEPYDITHGHHQTLAGLSTFEVIQEVAMLNNLTGIYDYLNTYLKNHFSDKMPVYTSVFKKWADVQIAHGVAFNNWNLMQAKNTLNIALILDDDKHYPDGKGNQYYTNYILNTTSQRQWSLMKVSKEGYDSVSGLWNESPGYSAGVLNDFMGFVSFFDNYYKLDLVAQMPILKKSVLAMAQYLFPNGLHASFGDSHYGRLNLNAAYQMVANAKKNNKPEQEKLFTRYIKTLQQFYKERGYSVERSEGGSSRNINALLYADENVKLADNVSAGDITEFVTPVLYSAHVSYLALRNEMDMQNGMTAIMSGSKGNHMHAGGISMELYGKGYVMAPESGIGTSYFQQDYAEYYSQFPAHNTVAVDGVSAYPVMKSNHGFQLLNAYPASGESVGFFPAVSFGNLYFLEPETNADQTRLTSIIRTSDSTAYYVDIFHSKRKDGKDKMHDYFYHDMGQQLLVNDNAGNPLPLQPTERLSFGGGHLFAYDYLYDKKSIATSKDINAVFKLTVPGKEEVEMNMWMKGEKDREIFALKSPPSKAIDRMGLPKEIAELPMPTIVARQSGEAWTKPFVAVYEPSTNSQPKSVATITAFKPVNAPTDFVGLKVTGKSGDEQFIYAASDSTKQVAYNDQSFNGTYGVISKENNKLKYLFIGSGKKIESGGYSIVSQDVNVGAALENKNSSWYFTSSAPVRISIPVTEFSGKAWMKCSINNKTYTGKPVKQNGQSLIVFMLPPSTYTKIDFK